MNKVIFLGTSAGIPTQKRSLPSSALIFKETNEFWLFDCGEGTQRQILKTDLKFSKLNSIFISHLHGDHIFGLPGLLATRGLLGINKPINIFGPAGLEKYLKSSFDYSFTYIPYPYHFYPVEKERFLTPGLLWEKGDTAIYCAILNHSIDSFGYAVTKKKRKRNILTKKLINLGIKPGPIYKKFKEDMVVNLGDGKIFKTGDFVKETIDIKKICYCGDTSFTNNAISLSEGADLLIHEATFCSDNREKAAESFHSTIEDAIKVARLARVKMLALIHISSRYENFTNEINKYTEELKYNISGDGPEIILTEDFMELTI